MLDPTIIDLRRIRARLGLSYERMGRLLGVSGRTVERMERLGRTSRRPVVAERLAQLAQIVDLGELVFTPDGWRQFLGFRSRASTVGRPSSCWNAANSRAGGTRL